MKATIESKLTYITEESTSAFVELLNCIAAAQNEAQLRREVKLLSMRNYLFTGLFEVGFGSHHMWVAECHNKTTRLIFVEF